MDVPSNSSAFEVGDLKVDTVYSFAVMADNEVGSSEYTADISGIRTKSESQKKRNHMDHKKKPGQNTV